MNDLRNLISALASFMEANWFPYEDSIGSINYCINGGTISKENLISEYSSVMFDKNFDWISLATESQLLISPESYSNEDIKNYVKFLLQDYLFPERRLTEQEIEELNLSVENVLKANSSINEWMLAYDVFEELKKHQQYKQLEYYNLWKLPFVKKRIIQKYIEGKDREIGYLKYNENPT
ncbi:hypothetical protein [Flavobacterium davisii]|uniref:hypothetical protein n=1 Tax=Flavobacterium davisii TaxID=2906077 RepID=UPI0035CF956E